jgi:hypothetical protein
LHRTIKAAISVKTKLERKETFLMKNPAVFFGAIAVAVIAILVAVYYLIPSIPHVLATPALGPHYKHATIFGVLAIIGIIGALVTRPKPATK